MKEIAKKNQEAAANPMMNAERLAKEEKEFEEKQKAKERKERIKDKMEKKTGFKPNNKPDAPKSPLMEAQEV